MNRRHRSLLVVAVSLAITGTATSASSEARPQTTTRSSGAAPTCGNHRNLTAGARHWTCTFDDEFNASTQDAHTLDSKRWVPLLTDTSSFTTGPSGSQACYVDSPRNIAVSKGVLRLTARRQAKPFDCHEGSTSQTNGFTTQYTGGEVMTYDRFNQTYGRFAVRAKLPPTSAKGLQETFWLWPADDLKYGGGGLSGEIDFAEFYSQYASYDIPYIHYGMNPLATNAATNTNVVAAGCPINVRRFNTYIATWTPGTIRLAVNGTTCLIDHYRALGLRPPAPFDQPFFIALTQALGVDANAFDPDSTPLPATTKVDYVRVWKQRA